MKRKMVDAKINLFDVVVLAASAGGHAAIARVLADLPPAFSTPIIVMLHLGSESTNTVEVIGRRAPFTVEWLKPESTLTPGKVLISPPNSFVELLPDGTFVLAPNERGAIGRPIDRLLESVTRSFGQRAIGVILTGMLSDGALGSRELHLAGGMVVVQSEASAEQPQMPRAAIQAGAADLVAPLQDIGQVIGELVAGIPRPQPHSEIQAILQVFGEAGPVAELARDTDWSQTGFGPVRQWSAVLRSMARLAMESPQPVSIYWGPQHLMLFNDAAIPALGRNYRESFAHPRSEAAPETQEDAALLFDRVLAGERVQQAARLVPVRRKDRVQHAWFDLSYTPVRDADGSVAGIYQVWGDRTEEVLASRRLRTLNALASIAGAQDRRQGLERALAALKDDPDIPFVAAYLIDASGQRASLIGVVGFEEGSEMAPRTALLTGAEWPFGEVVREDRPVYVEDIPTRFPDHASSEPRDAALQNAVIHPLHDEVEGKVTGFLVFGLDARLPLDESYRDFLALAADTVGAHMAESHARERERERLDRLAELDRAKTEFFANVSHEFRTPLTLLLAPLDDVLRHREELPAPLAEELDVAASNSRRLLRLVNDLLDFSQIDSQRKQANLEPTDLCSLTNDIASAFRSAIEGAGLRFHVHCDPDLPPVWVDREMWEKIVSNLLSNAFKFTFQGGISVVLRKRSLHAELVVEDTGIGIPEAELPNIFKRFHRVRGAQARTMEGSGIGLSMVQDLVQRQGGQIRVRSQENRGTEFTIWMPYKSPRIKSEMAETAQTNGTHEIATYLADEASRWLANGHQTPIEAMDDLAGPPQTNGEARQGTILVADDNADMREYLRRLLSTRWEVELTADGESALKAAKQSRPDVILADVMMPGLDGFELMQRIREDEQVSHTPVILLTARAGEEAAIQGLLAGADDYIAKPFSPRELVARVQSLVERSRAEQALRASEEKYRVLYRSIDQSFSVIEMIYDERGEPADYRLIETNPAFEELTGFRAADGRTALELMPNLEKEWIETYGRIAETGDPVRFTQGADELGKWHDTYAFRFGDPAQRRVAVLSTDVTAFKVAEATLRKSEERQRFLLNLSDALRPLSVPADIQGEAARILGESVNAAWTYYGEYDEPAAHMTVRADYRCGDSPSLLGTYPIASFELLAELIKGRTVAVEDTLTSPLFSEGSREQWGRVGMRSFIAAPIVKNGVLIAVLVAAERAPRDWSGVAGLIEETAERTRAAVERARAEAALRTNEKRMRGQKEAFQAAINGAPLEDALDILARLAAEETAGEARTAFYIADPEGLSLHPVWGAGSMPEPYLKEVDGFAIGENSLACGLALGAGRPVLTRDVLEEPLWEPWVYLAKEYGFRGCWSFPIKTRENKAVGTFAMYFGAPREATPHDLALADIVTHTAAVIISTHCDSEERARAEAT